jgi:cytochrome P450
MWSTVLFLSVHMHRDPALFDNPLEFDPDRWVTPGRASTENFWAFSKGPQNCLGQELAMIESALALVFTVRFLDFDPNYPPDAIDLPTWGGKAYQTQGATANPKDGIPMKLYLRKAI